MAGVWPRRDGSLPIRPTAADGSRVTDRVPVAPGPLHVARRPRSRLDAARARAGHRRPTPCRCSCPSPSPTWWPRCAALGRRPRVTDPDLAADAHAYAAQEAQHHGQHRRFNQLLVARYPGCAGSSGRWAGSSAGSARRSTRFGLAFAAGFETIAFVAARWVDQHQRLLRDADPTAATLFLWHLAEEVEHKEVAFDVYQASGGGRLRYAWAMTVAAVDPGHRRRSPARSTMLAAEQRLFSPVAHLRLVGWSLSFIFAALPVMVMSALPGHHPRDLADPAGLEHWLDHLDPETATVPEWALPVTCRHRRVNASGDRSSGPGDDRGAGQGGQPSSPKGARRATRRIHAEPDPDSAMGRSRRHGPSVAVVALAAAPCSPPASPRPTRTRSTSRRRRCPAGNGTSSASAPAPLHPRPGQQDAGPLTTAQVLYRTTDARGRPWR